MEALRKSCLSLSLSNTHSCKPKMMYGVSKGNVSGLLIVALCWGATNPFLKRGTRGLEQVSLRYAHRPWIHRTTAELLYLLTQWTVGLPFDLMSTILFIQTWMHSIKF